MNVTLKDLQKVISNTNIIKKNNLLNIFSLICLCMICLCMMTYLFRMCMLCNGFFLMWFSFSTVFTSCVQMLQKVGKRIIIASQKILIHISLSTKLTIRSKANTFYCYLISLSTENLKQFHHNPNGPKSISWKYDLQRQNIFSSHEIINISKKVSSKYSLYCRGFYL